MRERKEFMTWSVAFLKDDPYALRFEELIKSDTNIPTSDISIIHNPKQLRSYVIRQLIYKYVEFNAKRLTKQNDQHPQA
jgi:hypothetical protein